MEFTKISRIQKFVVSNSITSHVALTLFKCDLTDRTINIEVYTLCTWLTTSHNVTFLRHAKHTKRERAAFGRFKHLLNTKFDRHIFREKISSKIRQSVKEYCYSSFCSLIIALCALNSELRHMTVLVSVYLILRTAHASSALLENGLSVFVQSVEEVEQVMSGLRFAYSSFFSWRQVNLPRGWPCTQKPLYCRPVRSDRRPWPWYSPSSHPPWEEHKNTKKTNLHAAMFLFGLRVSWLSHHPQQQHIQQVSWCHDQWQVIPTLLRWLFTVFNQTQ